MSLHRVATAIERVAAVLERRPEEGGKPVFAGPSDMHLDVRIAARGVSRERLRELVLLARHCSPMPNAVQSATPMTLHVEVAAG